MPLKYKGAIHMFLARLWVLALIGGGQKVKFRSVPLIWGGLVWTEIQGKPEYEFYRFLVVVQKVLKSNLNLDRS